MKYQCKFSQHRVKSNISGAIPLKSDLTKPFPEVNFAKKVINNKQLVDLCSILDQQISDHQTIEEYFQDKNIVIGSQKFVNQELERVAALDQKNMKGFLLGFPFKCPVPIKTNYHQAPDLGELMFLYRLGNLAKSISINTSRTLKILILEETDSLSPVFKITNSECIKVQQRLSNFIKLLDLTDYLEIKPLYKALGYSKSDYHLTLKKVTNEIAANPSAYHDLLVQILPTIALSMNVNHLSLDECRSYVKKSFQRNITSKENPELFECAFGYIAFSEIQKRSNFRANLSEYLQMTLCPKKGRVGVRPTLSLVKILPHHGVPVVFLNKKKISFDIMYYIDLVELIPKHTINEIQDRKGNFLYYEVC